MHGEWPGAGNAREAGARRRERRGDPKADEFKSMVVELMVPVLFCGTYSRRAPTLPLALRNGPLLSSSGDPESWPESRKRSTPRWDESVS
ncbi:hypothetical protein ACJRO7_009760 [Eucalyptus globulus]|uniref:Uncharacterized protein n=1 Tax=Eucalyptus globulus TaxID=34317 RepID=A0ABD3L9T6_EUCGL